MVSKDKMQEIALTGLAFASSLMLKKILEAAYQKVYQREPPNAVSDKEIKWGHVVGWTILSGLTATAAKVLVKRYGAKKLSS